MTDNALTAIEFDTFCRYLKEELLLDDDLEAVTSFVNDLDFDSIRLLELLVVIEELGVEFSDEQYDVLERDVMSIYDTYQRLSNAGSSVGTSSARQTSEP